MFRNFGVRCLATAFGSLDKNIRNIVTIRSTDKDSIDVEIEDFQYIAYLQRPDIDGWEMRKCFNEILGGDAVPHPKLIIAALHCCRRLNDFACTIRFLEGCRDKCGDKLQDIWPYIMQEISPTLNELGCVSPEQIGWDRPELALADIVDLPAVERIRRNGNQHVC